MLYLLLILLAGASLISFAQGAFHGADLLYGTGVGFATSAGMLFLYILTL